MKQRLGILIALALAVAVVAAPAAQSKGALPTPVIVSNNVYTPKFVHIAKNHKVKWSWVDDNHNVVLYKAPKGVNLSVYSSLVKDTGYVFTRRFKEAGTYRFECTIHPEMRMTVKVGG